MRTSSTIRDGLRVAWKYRVGGNVQRRNYIATASLQSAEESKLPRVANPSFWSSLIPRSFKRTTDPVVAEARAKRRQVGTEERRVGIVFMVLGVLVGSNAIQLISIKKQTADFSRKTDAKLSLLREVVQRVKDGEDVDIKKVLGTGDPEHEKEWEEVIKELENPEMLLAGSKKRRSRDSSNNPKAKDEAKDKVSSDAAPDEGNPTSGTRSKFLM